MGRLVFLAIKNLNNCVRLLPMRNTGFLHEAVGTAATRKVAWMLPFAAFCAWLFFELGADFTEAAPIFLSCSGKRTEITGSYWGPPGNPGEKVTGTDDVTAWVKIDPDMQTFAWSENPFSASWPHCKLSKEGQVEQSSGYCTYILSNDVIIIFTIAQPPVPTGGSIDRVTGEMSAEQRLGDDRHKRWNMTCSPTKQKF
jgi:hypothetical protein